MKPCALCQTTPSCQLIALKGVTLLVWKYYFMPVRLHYVWHFHGFSEKDWNKLCVSMTGCDKVPKDIIWVGFPWVIVMCRQNDGFIHPSIRILICLNKVVVSYKWSNFILFFLNPLSVTEMQQHNNKAVHETFRKLGHLMLRGSKRKARLPGSCL